MVLNGFGTVINGLGQRAKPYLPQVRAAGWSCLAQPGLAWVWVGAPSLGGGGSAWDCSARTLQRYPARSLAAGPFP